MVENVKNKLLNIKTFFTGSQIPKISLEEIQVTLECFKKTLFPGVFHEIDNNELAQILDEQLNQLRQNLVKTIITFGYSSEESNTLSSNIILELPRLKEALMKDIDAIYNGDPAALSHEEVVLAYPSFEAIMTYRIAHTLTQQELNLFARMCTSIAHRNTGIDIHPKAQIGESFCIDHGTAIVIGETSVIGNNVKMYQGVTIGALSVSKSQENKKRHPTIEDNVTIYARTTILGGKTIVGKNSIIGGNVWLTKSVPENSKIYNKDFKIEHS
ncbi:MAG: serine O-acetyltransferase EpsC [Candidatus Margulisiibacteriota bacterium]|nr:serine O-acetyltransferase EpsC [Candidatus Margulisiibacteriota bacterium]